MTIASSPDLLGTIVAAARRAASDAEARRPCSQLERLAAARVPRAVSFRQRLTVEAPMPVIAECKRRSPSRGILRDRYRPADLAVSYEQAGAAAVSVLTEPGFFDGSLDHLAAVRDAVGIPVLRKDFIVTEYQLVEARAAGADAVLLIVAATSNDGELQRLLMRATELELAALVEVHDAVELARAVDAGAEIIGINNRNLKTLDVDGETAARLIDGLPPDVTAVAESGLRTGQDLRRLRAAGYDAFLIGEALVVQDDPGEALRGLLADAGRVPIGRARRGQSRGESA